MTYASPMLSEAHSSPDLGRAPGYVAGLGAVRIGERAKQDAVLAQASLEASELLLKVASLPAAQRWSRLLAELGAKGDPLLVQAAKEHHQRLGSSWQGAFDALRLSLADHALRGYVLQLAAEHDRRRTSGEAEALGTLQDVGCTVTGIVSGIGAGIVGIFGGGGGGAGEVAKAGNTVAEGIGCNNKQRRHEQQLAAEATRQAELNMRAAQITADATDRATRSAEERTKLLLLAGGIGVVAVVATFLILR